jgi:hypothetical protein
MYPAHHVDLIGLLAINPTLQPLATDQRAQPAAGTQPSALKEGGAESVPTKTTGSDVDDPAHDLVRTGSYHQAIRAGSRDQPAHPDLGYSSSPTLAPNAPNAAVVPAPKMKASPSAKPKRKVKVKKTQQEIEDEANAAAEAEQARIIMKRNRRKTEKIRKKRADQGKVTSAPPILRG